MRREQLAVGREGGRKKCTDGIVRRDGGGCLTGRLLLIEE